ncbi:MAG: helix-turn-helix transcriptional regulator [Lachnospiraceae bacterium]|nr:helix-turn-helix transcriptional regulator [Lachnospiraceae bacterium]
MKDKIEKSSEDTLLKNLKKLREIHGLSQQRFADLFNLSQQSIYKYENDISEPSIDTLTKIADYFNTSIDYLVDFTDIPCPLEQRNEETLSPTEKELIDNYRCLSPAYRHLIDALVETHLREIILKQNLQNS